jgi:hypothetical protein
MPDQTEGLARLGRRDAAPPSRYGSTGAGMFRTLCRILIRPRSCKQSPSGSPPGQPSASRVAHGADLMFGWLSKKRAKTDPHRIAETAGAIIADYGDFLEKNLAGAAIQDEQQLPHSKETILAALLVALATQDFPVARRLALVDCAMYLSYFQKDVGVHPLRQLGIDMTKFDVASMSGENLVALMSSSPAGKEKYDQFFPLVQADINRIGERVNEADRLWSAARKGSEST